ALAQAVTEHVQQCGGRWANPEEPNAPDSSQLLRPRYSRPCRHATDQRYELAPSHSITSSARLRSVGGTVRPSAVAVFILITKSNLVGCSTGRSAGLAPCSILTAEIAVIRNASAKDTLYDIKPPASANGRNAVATGSRYVRASSAAILAGILPCRTT